MSQQIPDDEKARKQRQIGREGRGAADFSSRARKAGGGRCSGFNGRSGLPGRLRGRRPPPRARRADTPGRRSPNRFPAQRTPRLHYAAGPGPRARQSSYAVAMPRREIMPQFRKYSTRPGRAAPPGLTAASLKLRGCGGGAFSNNPLARELARAPEGFGFEAITPDAVPSDLRFESRAPVTLIINAISRASYLPRR